MKNQLIIIYVLLALLAGSNIYTYVHFKNEINLTDQYAYFLTEAIKSISVNQRF